MVDTIPAVNKEEKQNREKGEMAQKSREEGENGGGRKEGGKNRVEGEMAQTK